MQVVTKASLIATVAERFRQAHQRRSEWLPTATGEDARAIFAALTALPPTADEAAITATVGDNRWTENVCDECGEDQAVVVLLGEEIDHPTDMLAVCPSCLKSAQRLASASS
jgi:hypothetical protein